MNKRLKVVISSGATLAMAAASVVFSFGRDSMGQAAEQPTVLSSEMYKDLYLARIAADLGKNTAISKRLDQGDIKTAKAAITALLKADLLTIEVNTNLFWSDEQRLAIEAAREYQKNLDRTKAGKS